MKIILYTIHCPLCNKLEKKLNEKQIPFVVEDNEQSLIIKFGEQSNMPLLEVDGQILTFAQALTWLRNYNGGITTK